LHVTIFRNGENLKLRVYVSRVITHKKQQDKTVILSLLSKCLSCFVKSDFSKIFN